MKIAISMLSGISYGGITYFNQLLPAIARADSGSEYHIFVPRNSHFVTLVRQDNIRFHTVCGQQNRSFVRFCWEQLVLPIHLRRLRIDVLYTAKNLTVFFAPCSTVTAVRNMEPFFFSRYKNHWLRNLVSWLRLVLTMLSLRRSSGIIAVSGFAGDTVLARLPQAEAKLRVIYNGNPLERVTSGSGSRPPAATEAYILTASKFIAYANQLNLLKAYTLLCRKRKDLPKLYLAGGSLDHAYHRSAVAYVRVSGIEDRVVFLGLLEHERLTAFMSCAQAFVYPSKLEACPQTLIEALSCGLPVAASSLQPMPEICANAALYFDPDDPEDIAGKMEQLIFEDPLRKKLASAAKERCAHFSWDRTARQTIDFLKEAGQKR